MHHAGKLTFRHLPVTNIHARLGDKFVEMRLHRVNRVHAVVDEEDLSAAFEFAQNGLPHKSRRIWSDMRHNRQAFFGRCIQIGDVAHTCQRHVKRARNWRGGQRQHIHFGAEFFEMLLVCHAETLFFIDHDQTQILELHIRRDQAMCADDDVNFTKRKFATKSQSAHAVCGNAKAFPL